MQFRLPKCCTRKGFYVPADTPSLMNSLHNPPAVRPLPLRRWQRQLSAVLAGACASAAMLVASPAFAQFAVSDRDILDLELEDGNEDTSNARWTVNIADCLVLIDENPEVTLQWKFGTSPPNNTKFAIKLQPPGSTCSFTSTTVDADQEGCILLAASDDLNGTTVSRAITLQALLGVSDTQACFANDDNEYILGIIYTNPSDTTPGDDANDFVNSQISVDLNLSRPIAPTLDAVSAGENSILVEWSLPSADNETDDYIVYFSESEMVAGDFAEETTGLRAQAAIAESVTLTDGVEVDRTYNVAVVMLDSDGNRSVLSNVEQAVTTPTRDFYEQYLASGGVEQGGLCSSTRVPDGGMLGAAAILLLWTIRRRGPRS